MSNLSLKQKLLNAVSAHPKLVTFGIGLAITFAIGTAIGMLDHQHLAFAQYTKNSYNNDQSNYQK
jgi:predicted DNA-binding protein with PD1-like motif